MLVHTLTKLTKLTISSSVLRFDFSKHNMDFFSDLLLFDTQLVRHIQIFATEKKRRKPC